MRSFIIIFDDGCMISGKVGNLAKEGNQCQKELEATFWQSLYLCHIVTLQRPGI